MELPQVSRSPGQVAYESYADALGWQADGHRMRTWDDLNALPHLRDAWEIAAEAVTSAHMAQSGAEAKPEPTVETVTADASVTHADGTPG